MAYATLADMVARFGEHEVIELSDRSRIGEVDPVVVADALVDASGEIDSYLSGRYTVPLVAVPRLMIGLCCDIARYRLCGSETRETEVINTRYKNAIRFLEKAAKGEVLIGPDSNGNQVEVENLVVFTSGGRVFGRERGAA